MAIDLRGITNENEFYTHHYLAAILEGDLKALFEAWAQQESPPPDQLRQLARPFQEMQKELEETADPSDRLALERACFARFFAALGYTLAQDSIEAEDGTVLPLAGQLNRSTGQPDLWILEADGAAEDEDPLEQWEEKITRYVFGAAEPPRWALLYGGTQVLLLERTKWPAKRFLRFDLEEILGRRETSTLRATAALLHRDSICPADKTSLLDRLDENSHKHAFSVSEDLKYSAREAVELLGNEAVWYLREVLKEGIYGKELAQKLTHECLRYLYRLLFLFYVEARPELGYAPMNSEEYLTGYSLESLRDSAEQEISTEEDRNGFFLHNSLQTLFKLIFEGWRHELQVKELGDHNFRIEPLRCDLFDPARTPLLNRVRMRNKVLQRVIELLSLSREGHGRRGRISYSQLGINQLGAVYEGLLSYTGFFVEENDGLYEVKPSDDQYDPLKQAYFVTKQALSDYKEDEKVFINGRLVHHPKGEFVYRLAGRNRQKSASYYTPDVLTKCVVKYALKELLKDKAADDILKLNVCEPALGSGAFLNEAVNQLADAYLELKQRETGRTIAHDKYIEERQKVKAYLADNRVYGVDRNPVAIELAEVSLWLNTIYAHHTIPWFGGQLLAGNSLIGARRQVFHREDVESDNRVWLDTVPERIPMGQNRPEGRIWHFLLPDKGMADYTDKAVKEMLPAEMKDIREWRKQFTKRFDSADLRALERLSAAVDRLWQKHTEDIRRVRAETAHIFPVFGQESNPGFVERGHRLTTHERNLIFSRAITPRGGQASAYQRLRLAMDYWCALWFWPVDKANLLPSRDEFLMELSAILEGTDLSTRPILGAEQEGLFQTGKPTQEQFQITDELGTVNLESLCERLPRLRMAGQIADRHRFMHWELEFADLFQDYGGFDLLLGNPPWIRVEWDEGGVLSDREPAYVLRKLSAPETRKLRSETWSKHADLRADYVAEYVEFEGAQNYLNARQNYPLLQGSSPNLYKCFVTQSWVFSSDAGVQGFLHPEGIYDDPDAGALRATLYPRLRAHFHFRNELLLFSEIGNTRPFSVNVFAEPQEVKFVHISTLFHPSTIDASFDDDGQRACTGIKDENGSWNLAGYRERLICITERELYLFARLYDSDAGIHTLSARLPSLHSCKLVSVLEKFAAHSKRFSDLGDRCYTTQIWNETIAVDDGTIRRETRFPEDSTEWILSGPHLYVANPFFKTPRQECSSHKDFDTLPLDILPTDYKARTNYVPACERDVYLAKTPRVPWREQSLVTEQYRVTARRRLSQAGERTLLAAIVPPGPWHINACISLHLAETLAIAPLAASLASLPFDFFVKTTGRADFLDNLAKSLPLVSGSAAIDCRALALNCLTGHYSELWQVSWHDEFRNQRWSKKDTRLADSRFRSLCSTWSWETALRSDYERRQALIEIDVLIARQLKMSLEELNGIYRIQFPVLQQNEQDTWYDQRGRIVFTSAKGLPGVGFSRAEWERMRDMASGTVTRTVQDDTLPGGPRERVIEYLAPFDRCDREADYATAWAFFDREGM